MGNSLGRAPWARGDTGVTTGWTEGKLWEIAWGSWESSVGKERYGSDDWVDGRETVGNKAWGELRGEGAILK